MTGQAINYTGGPRVWKRVGDDLAVGLLRLEVRA